jgi:hypothetical protein
MSAGTKHLKDKARLPPFGDSEKAVNYLSLTIDNVGHEMNNDKNELSSRSERQLVLAIGASIHRD